VKARISHGDSAANKVATHFSARKRRRQYPASQSNDRWAGADWGSFAKFIIGPIDPCGRSTPTIPPIRRRLPEGFDWQLWLGPSLESTVSSALYSRGFSWRTNLAEVRWRIWDIIAVAVFREFDLEAPEIVGISTESLVHLERPRRCQKLERLLFPPACSIRFRFGQKGTRPPLDIFWYDGSIKPAHTEELEAEKQGTRARGHDVRGR